MSDKTKNEGEKEKQLSALYKENQSLTEELDKNQKQIKSLQQSITEVSRNFENFQLQNNNQASYMQPIIEKLQKMFQEAESYTKFMNQFEASKNKLIKIGNFKVDSYGGGYTGDAVR